MVGKDNLEGKLFLLISEDSNRFSTVGSTKVPNTTNLGLIATLSNYMDSDKLLNGISTILIKEFEVSVRAVRRRYAYCKKEYDIQQQIISAESGRVC